jgi:hypothetical protein
MIIVTGKHKEILVELLIYYLDHDEIERIIRGQERIRTSRYISDNSEWYINHYINNWPE